MTTAKKQIFELVPDPAILVGIVQSIPDSWLRLNGNLEAPDDLVRLGDAVKDTGLSLHRRTEFRIVGRNGAKEPGDSSAIVIHRRLPGFVIFSDIGVSSGSDFLFARTVAAAYLERGYLLGNLMFTRDELRELPARAYLGFREKNLCLSVEWGPERQKDVGQILDIAWSLGLREITALHS